MANPTVPTIKRLFAVSGNQCAFPECNIPLVDPSGKVTGRICHIKARSLRGPRYDPTQTEEDRHGFNNLLLMCPVHHDVIDNDPNTYSVPYLLQIKSDHEVKFYNGYPPSEDIVQQLLDFSNNTTIHNGSIITTYNQIGGQVAHSITNVGPQPRQISQSAANILVSDLKLYPSETIDVTCLMNDAESYQYAQQIKQILAASGWTVNGVNQAIFNGLPKRVIIQTPGVKPSHQVLLNWFVRIGANPSGEINQNQSLSIIVGTNI